MQAMGGFAEAGFGAGMTFATGGLAAPAGCAVMAHGIDHFFTGMKSVITGRPAESVTSQLFQKAGMSPQNAHLLDTGLSLAGPIAGMKLAQQGASAFRASTVNTGGKFIPAKSIIAVKEGVGNSLALSSKSGANLAKHLQYSQDYGRGGVKFLQNERVRYYGKLNPPRTTGEMIGARYVHEFHPLRGTSRGWMEMLDSSSRIRQVRPQFDSGRKTHYLFDKNGKLEKIW